MSNETRDGGPTDAGTPKDAFPPAGGMGSVTIESKKVDYQLLFKDAINAFKYSDTGRGNVRLRGTARYIKRWSKLAENTLKKLWEIWSEGDEIAYAKLPAKKDANSKLRWGPNIKINEKYRDDFVATSVLIVHEAVHLLIGQRTLEEEYACRLLTVSYYRDLLKGISFYAESEKKKVRVYVDPNDDPVDLKTQHLKEEKGRLIDWILSIGYSNLLTPAFVRKSINWWGGANNRTTATKKLYISALQQGVKTGSPGDTEIYRQLILKLGGTIAQGTLSIRKGKRGDLIPQCPTGMK